MKFDVSNFKSRDLNDVWVNLIGANGKPMFYLGDIPKKTAESLKDEIEQFNAGTYDGDALDKYKKPIRFKLKSPHSAAFSDAKRVRDHANYILTNGLGKSVAKEFEEQGEIDHFSTVRKGATASSEYVKNQIEMVIELLVDWEGFFDGEEKAEIDADFVRGFLSHENQQVTLNGLVKFIDEKRDFFTQ